MIIYLLYANLKSQFYCCLLTAVCPSPCLFFSLSPLIYLMYMHRETKDLQVFQVPRGQRAVQDPKVILDLWDPRQNFSLALSVCPSSIPKSNTVVRGGNIDLSCVKSVINYTFSLCSVQHFQLCLHSTLQDQSN